MTGALSLALEAACDRFGGAPALCSGSTPLSYTQLAHAARAVAAQLGSAGLEAHEPVHLRVSNRPLDIVALFAVWLAGGVGVAMHRNTPAAVAAAMQQRTRARFEVDLESPRGSAAALSMLATAAVPRRPLLDGAALVIFTSGSTGEPKGVVLSHRALQGKIEQIDSLLAFGPADRTLLVLNLNFAFGLWLSLLTLLRGGTLVMSPKFESGSFLHTLRDERITRVGMVPTMMRVLFADSAHEAMIERVVQQGQLLQILIGGEALGLSLAQAIRTRFANTELIDIYGLTETSTCDFFAFPADAGPFPGCVGRPAPGVHFRIVDAQGQAVDKAAVGELQIRSPYLMRGYLDAPELSAASFSDGWFRTGDLARERGDQVVELMGRLPATGTVSRAP